MEQIAVVLECDALVSLFFLIENTEDTEIILFAMEILEDILKAAERDVQLKSLSVVG